MSVFSEPFALTYASQLRVDTRVACVQLVTSSEKMAGLAVSNHNHFVWFYFLLHEQQIVCCSQNVVMPMYAIRPRVVNQHLDCVFHQLT